MTDCTIRAETTTTALNIANEGVSDSVLVDVVLKGLLNKYTPFVVRQPNAEHNFQKFQ